VRPKKRLLDRDGLPVSEIGAWSEDKIDLVKYYATLFTTSMKGKWDRRIYIDLFAGPGKSKIKGKDKIIDGTAIHMLELKDPFDIYVFCELEADLLNALQIRVNQRFPNIDARFISGDCNKKADDILSQVPHPQPGFKVLCFCFVDPFNMGNLRFKTIEKLASRFVDFLVLIPCYMDANRNEERYTHLNNKIVERFLGNTDWRHYWGDAKLRKEDFATFITNSFGRQMSALGYRFTGLADTKLIRNRDRNQPLYRLALFSRNDLGNKFWEEARKYSNPTLPLFPK
jgi:three-Cys-motif partner protein